MKSNFKKFSVTLALLAACSGYAHAADYFSNNQPVDTVVNAGRVQPIGDVEVVEFFWYGCPHCAKFEPAIQAWSERLPARVKFVRIPASWSEGMQLQQQLYYTLEALNRLDLHAKVFNDIHQKRQPMGTAAHISRWAVAQKINKNQWDSTFKGSAVAQRVAHAQAAFKRFELNWVPAVVVNGKRVVAFTPDILQHTEDAVALELQQLGSAAAQQP